MSRNMKKYIAIASILISMVFIFNLLSTKEKKIVEMKEKGMMYVYLLKEDTLIEVETNKNFKSSEENIKDIIHYMKQDIAPFEKLLNINTIIEKVVVKDKVAHLYFEQLEYEPLKELNILESLIYSCTQFEDVDKIEIYLKAELLQQMPIHNTLIMFKDRTFKMNHSDMNQQYLHQGEYVNMYFQKRINNKKYDVLKAVKIKDASDYFSFIKLLLEQTYGSSMLEAPLSNYSIRLDKCYFQDGVLEIYTNSGVLGNDKKINPTVLKYMKKNLSQFKEIRYLKFIANDKVLKIGNKDKIKI